MPFICGRVLLHFISTSTDQRLDDTTFSLFTIVWAKSFIFPYEIWSLKLILWEVQCATSSPHRWHNISRVVPHFVFSSLACHSTGVGLATVIISFVFSTYHNVLICWALYYLFNSFDSTLPWTSCNNTWNAVGNCSSGFSGNSTHLQSASQQFFEWEKFT